MRGATWNMSIEYANVTSFRINSRSLNLSFSQNFTFSIMQAAASSSDFTMNFIYSFTGYTNTTICLQWNDTVVHREACVSVDGVMFCGCGLMNLHSTHFQADLHTKASIYGEFTFTSAQLRRRVFTLQKQRKNHLSSISHGSMPDLLMWCTYEIPFEVWWWRRWQAYSLQTFLVNFDLFIRVKSTENGFFLDIFRFYSTFFVLFQISCTWFPHKL